MNDRPKCSLEESHARLTAPGMPFETVEAMIRGARMPVWKHVPTTARAAFDMALAHGNREFLVCQDMRVTHDGFARAVRVLAADLVARGLKKSDRVALAMKNVPEWPVVFMATLLAGGIIVPLNAWWTTDELAFGLADCGARFVFADAERLTRLPPTVAQIFGPTELDAVIGAPTQWSALPDVALPDVDVLPEDDATIFYTSGTTGKPRGALGTHRSLTTNIFAAAFVSARNELRFGTAPLTRPRTTLLAVPFFHVVGALSVLLPSLAMGGKIVLMPKFDADEALAVIARERVTVAGGVPSVALALLDAAQKNDKHHDLSSLELITYGGAPPPADLAARIAALDIAPGQGWGMTETAATCTSHSGPDYLDRPASCGPALPVNRLKVMQDGVQAPPGTVDALWAFGPNIAKGYWNDPDATAQSFRDGWLNTGDLASLDEDGFCTIHDRAHDMVIRGGENIYCIEVENILVQHPAVADAALVGLPHALLGEVPAALVTLRSPVSEQALRDFAGARLAAFKVPVRVLVSETPLPRSETGKLVKRDLHKAFGA